LSYKPLSKMILGISSNSCWMVVPAQETIQTPL